MNCGLVFIPRSDSSMKNYYKKSPNLACRKAMVSKSLLLRLAEERVDSMQKIFKISFENKSVLDVGCGYGEILSFLKINFACSVMGIEASQEAAEWGKKLFSIPVENTLLEELTVDRQFDLILCNHTLEHVDDPISFLKRLRELLDLDGILYVEVPNIFKPSGGFTLDKFLYAEHIQNFSAPHLYQLLKQCGFFTLAFSDEGFLKFFVGKKEISNSIKIPDAVPDQVITFLKQYRDEYSSLNHACVYGNKFKYLLRLLYHFGKDFADRLLRPGTDKGLIMCLLSFPQISFY